MTTATRPAPHHNNLTCYVNYNCRLPDCAERYRTNERTRRQEKKLGTYQRYTDAGPVRAHIQQFIAAGASPRGIAIRANVSDKVVRDLLPTRPDGTRAPLKHRMIKENAHKLFAITPDDVIPHYVPALGTIRRIQAQVADGWPMTLIANQAGLFPSYVSGLLQRDAACDDLKVRGTTALAVARAHDELRTQKPGRRGATRKATRTARRIGKTRNWPPTAYWDGLPGAIDDPDFTPDYGLSRAEILATEAHWLIHTGGLKPTEVATRLGKDPSYITRVLADHPMADAA